jgi:hypothetical protein
MQFTGIPVAPGQSQRNAALSIQTETITLENFPCRLFIPESPSTSEHEAFKTQENKFLTLSLQMCRHSSLQVHPVFILNVLSINVPTKNPARHET